MSDSQDSKAVEALIKICKILGIEPESEFHIKHNLTGAIIGVRERGYNPICEETFDRIIQQLKEVEIILKNTINALDVKIE